MKTAREFGSSEQGLPVLLAWHPTINHSLLQAPALQLVRPRSVLSTETGQPHTPPPEPAAHGPQQPPRPTPLLPPQTPVFTHLFSPHQPGKLLLLRKASVTCRLHGGTFPTSPTLRRFLPAPIASRPCLSQSTGSSEPLALWMAEGLAPPLS